MRRSAVGFTLIELMIAVVIIGILASVAYPSYQDSVRQSRRADAKSALIGLQLNIEKSRANQTSYANALPFALGGTINSPDGNYTITIDAASANAFQVTAAPVVGSDQANDACTSFIINQNGPVTGTAAQRACWGM